MKFPTAKDASAALRKYAAQPIYIKNDYGRWILDRMVCTECGNDLNGDAPYVGHERDCPCVAGHVGYIGNFRTRDYALLCATVAFTSIVWAFIGWLFG